MAGVRSLGHFDKVTLAGWPVCLRACVQSTNPAFHRVIHLSRGIPQVAVHVAGDTRKGRRRVKLATKFIRKCEYKNRVDRIGIRNDSKWKGMAEMSDIREYL